MTLPSQGLNIGIIMDGNGRWAKKNGVPRSAGHKQGAKAFQEIVKHCRNIGVNAVTFYAFSTENWKRSKQEVNSLMALFKQYLESAIDYENENNRVIFLGERDGLSHDLTSLMDKIERETADRSGMTLNVALNYGSRKEITEATRKIVRLVQNGELSPENIDEDLVQNMLYTGTQPQLDLLIRPSGEERISNFMLWQSAYAEFVFMDVLWPDFTPQHLDAAIEEYSNRNRRFGGR